MPDHLNPAPLNAEPDFPGQAVVSAHGVANKAVLFAHLALAAVRCSHYMCGRRAAWYVGQTIPGALPILKGAVPDRARGPGYTAPTYFVGSRDRKRLTAKAARPFPSGAGFPPALRLARSA